MIEISEKLAKPFELVRIDFYLGKSGKIYFSEYTFTPNDGNIILSLQQEFQLGKIWTRNPPI